MRLPLGYRIGAYRGPSGKSAVSHTPLPKRTLSDSDSASPSARRRPLRRSTASALLTPIYKVQASPEMLVVDLPFVFMNL